MNPRMPPLPTDMHQWIILSPAHVEMNRSSRQPMTNTVSVTRARGDEPLTVDEELVLYLRHPRTRG